VGKLIEDLEETFKEFKYGLYYGPYLSISIENEN